MLLCGRLRSSSKMKGWCGNLRSANPRDFSLGEGSPVCARGRHFLDHLGCDERRMIHIYRRGPLYPYHDWISAKFFFDRQHVRHPSDTCIPATAVRNWQSSHAVGRGRVGHEPREVPIIAVKAARQPRPTPRTRHRSGGGTHEWYRDANGVWGRRTRRSRIGVSTPNGARSP